MLALTKYRRLYYHHPSQEKLLCVEINLTITAQCLWCWGVPVETNDLPHSLAFSMMTIKTYLCVMLNACLIF